MLQNSAVRSATGRAIQAIRENDGVIRTSDALKLGIHPRTLYSLRDAGTITPISRGVYHLVAEKALSDTDLISVAMRIPRAVISLVSALAFHGLTTQVPHAVDIALERGAETPRIDYPPVSVHRFSGESLTAGIEEHRMDGVTVRVYSKEKTLADCFKFRNRIGMDIVLEALKLYKEQGEFRLGKLMECARICRVEKIMRPYLEAIL